MSSASARAPVQVPLGRVEQELSQQLRALQGEGEQPVQRVRMSNLVIFCDSEDNARAIEAQIPDVVAAHPARVLLLIADENHVGGDLMAQVSVRAHRLGKSQQACSEQVTLRAGGEAVESLQFAARSLLIGDLPTNLWWASHAPPGLGGMQLYHLGEPAQQIIYDSLGWRDPAHGVATTSAWLLRAERGGAGRWRVSSDLNWRRLKYWRRLFSQALDPAIAPGAAESITYVMLEHGPKAVVQAWLLVSWLAQGLGWRVQEGKTQPGVEINWTLQGPDGDVRVKVRRLDIAPPEVRQARIVTRINGKPAALTLCWGCQDQLTTKLEGLPAEPRTMNLPHISPAELVSRQLSDRERDPTFRESMALARVLAESLFHY